VNSLSVTYFHEESTISDRVPAAGKIDSLKIVRRMPSRILPNSFLTPDPGTIFTSNADDITDELGAVMEDKLGAVMEDELGAVVEDALAVACLVTSDELGMVAEDALAASCLES
jgi:hypothetical protein